jgi:hypothetical protein
MILEHTGGVGEALAWMYMIEVLGSWGYPTNLSGLHGYRTGEISLRYFASAFPTAGVNSDGTRLSRGGRFEYAYRFRHRVEAAVGVNRVSFAASPFRDRDADYEEAYAHTFMYAGVRYTRALTSWSVGRRLPDALSFGFDILIPPIRETTVVGMAPSESVDLSQGEYVNVRTAIDARAGVSFAARFGYRVSVIDRIGIYISPSLYAFNFDYLESSPFRGFVDGGIDLRLPD